VARPAFSVSSNGSLTVDASKKNHQLSRDRKSEETFQTNCGLNKFKPEENKLNIVRGRLIDSN